MKMSSKEHEKKWLEDTLDELKKKPFYCPFPFRYVYGEESGEWKLCSEAYVSGHSSNDTSLYDWFTSDYINSIRDEMLSDNPNFEKLEDCYRCIKAEEDSGNSTRTELNIAKETVYNTYAYQKAGEYLFLNRPLVLQMRMFNNNDVCNLGCYMCFPKFSSKRKVDLNKTRAYDFIDRFNPNDPENVPTEIRETSSMDEIVELIDCINTIEIIGGEPLYVKESYDFIEKLIKRADTSKTRLTIFTNLSVIENKHRNFLNFAKYFKKITFKISCDGFGKYNEYIRKGSDWEKLKANIIAVRNSPNCDMFIWSVISNLSILRFELLEEWTRQENIHHEINILRDPEELSIIHLPDKLKNELIKRFSHHPRIVNTLKAPRDESKFQKAINYINELDSIYPTKLLDVFPEFKEFL